jgi:hypothetical protein
VKQTLLETVRGLLERTYRIRSGLAGLGSFVIGDRGYVELYGTSRGELDVRSAVDSSAKTLVREIAGGTAVCVYFPDALIRRLEAHPPQHGLGAENLDAFATFVEEIDHLLVVAERARHRRPVSLLELELHANVSKYLVLARFLAGSRGSLAQERRLWLRYRLFERVRFCDEDPVVRERYRNAARWAGRMLNGLSPLRRTESVEALRQFHRFGLDEKLRQISRLAA